MSETLEFTLHLPPTPTTGGGLQHFRRKRKRPGTDDDKTTAHLLCGSLNTQVVAPLERRLQGLHPDGEFIQENTAELNEELRIASCVSQDVVAIQLRLVDGCRFHWAVRRLRRRLIHFQIPPKARRRCPETKQPDLLANGLQWSYRQVLGNSKAQDF
jgi:hypothetical protein